MRARGAEAAGQVGEHLQDEDLERAYLHDAHHVCVHGAEVLPHPLGWILPAATPAAASSVGTIWLHSCGRQDLAPKLHLVCRHCGSIMSWRVRQGACYSDMQASSAYS